MTERMTERMTIAQYKRHIGLPTREHAEESAASAQCRQEKELQRLCEQELTRRGVRFVLHLRTKQQAAAYPGMPDLVFVWRGVPMAVELKAPTGKLSEDQIRVMDDMRCDGWHTEMIRDFDAFRDLLDMMGPNV